MSGRVLVIGLGDLGRRFALALSGHDAVRDLVLGGRRRRAGRSLAALAAACGTARVRYESVDAARAEGVAGVISRVEPDLVLQCASLSSPWALHGRDDAAAQHLRRAGFAAQLPAQLPLLASVMRGVREAGWEGPVVNASYPEVTHAVCAAHDLAPTVGIGNVSMIAARVKALLRERTPNAGQIRVLGHHAHVTPVVTSTPPADAPAPCVYVGDPPTRRDALAFAGAPIQSDRHLNALTVATALPVVAALLPGGTAYRGSVPAPHGLPGGYPVVIEERAIRLDLPAGLSRDEATAFHRECARRDGVAEIEADGTIHFTEACRRHLYAVDPKLAEPLTLADARARFRRLRACLS